MLQKTLLIYPDSKTGIWMIDTHGPDRATQIELFGTAVLPTPFRQPVTLPAVFHSLANLNPEATFYLFTHQGAYRETIENGFEVRELAPCIVCAELLPPGACCQCFMGAL